MCFSSINYVGERMSSDKLHVSEVTILILKEVKGLWKKIVSLIRSWFRDIYYYPIDIEELHKLLEDWKNYILPELAYTKETFDCDDFGAFFKAWLTKESGKNCVAEALGVVHVPDVGDVGHEWNIVLARFPMGEVEVVHVEPQIGQAFITHTYDGWKYSLVWVLF